MDTPQVNLVWEQLIFSFMGGQLKEYQVVGVSLSVRRDFAYLRVWMRDSSNFQKKMGLSERLKVLLEFDKDTTPLYFKSHVDAIKVTTI